MNYCIHNFVQFQYTVNPLLFAVFYFTIPIPGTDRLHLIFMRYLFFYLILCVKCIYQKHSQHLYIRKTTAPTNVEQINRLRRKDSLHLQYSDIFHIEHTLFQDARVRKPMSLLPT